jgi:peptidoglycan/LPS O-acetylase OafA/YrhL
MRLTFQSTVARSDKYRPDIDGLRAIAVLPVIFYHAKIPGFPGGFVGVDVFYVISGYLITSLIEKEILLGRFSFSSFYERRIRRIFPALFAVLFFCTLAAGVLFVPKDFVAFGKSMIAVTFFGGNEFFKRTGGVGGYFDRTAESQALLHTWSLSVEEQFYLFFPTTLLLLARWGKGRLTRYLFAFAVLSFLISIWAIRYRPLIAFYSLIPRAWELLLGALLAMKAAPPLKERVSREIAGLMGLALIACAVVFFTQETAFPGWRALLPCVGAWLIIYAGENGPSSVGTFLSFRPLVFIGVISYSLYLWHWPIIVFSRYFCAGALNGVQTAGVIVLSLVMAFISFEFIERPFRGRGSPITRQQIFYFGFAASMFSIVLGLAIYGFHGFPGRYNNATRQLVLENVARKNDFQEVCGNWKTEVRSIADIGFCNLGSDLNKKIMFLGDSHVQQLYPLIKKLYDAGELEDHGVVLAVENACLPAEHLNSIGKGYHCDAFTHFALMRAEEPDVDTVFIAFNTWFSVHAYECPSVDGRCVGTISVEEARDRFLEELGEHIRKLRMDGKRVIVSLPFPMYDKSIPDLEIRNAVFGGIGLNGVAKDITLPIMRDQLASVARAAGADTFDPRESLCDEWNCITQLNGVSIYIDDNHIAASQIGILEGDFRKALQPTIHPVEKVSGERTEGAKAELIGPGIFDPPQGLVSGKI